MAVAANLAFLAFGASGTEQSLLGYANTAEMKRVVKELEATTFGDTEEKFSPSMKNNELSFGGDWSQTLDGYLAPLLGTDARSVIFGPAGNTAGFVKYSAAAFLREYSIKSDVLGKVVFTGTIRIQGVVTRTTF